MPTEAEILAGLKAYEAQFRAAAGAGAGAGAGAASGQGGGLPTAQVIPGVSAAVAPPEGPSGQLPSPTPRTFTPAPTPEGGSTLAQIGFSFKRPDARLSYLRSIYGGPDNAFQDPESGEFFFRNPKSGSFEPFVPERLGSKFASHFKDIGKFAALTAIAPTAGASLPVAAAQMAAQGAALEGIDTGISSVLPGDASTPGQFAGDVALGGMAGGLSPILGAGVVKGVGKVGTGLARAGGEIAESFRGSRAAVRSATGVTPTSRMGRLMENLHATATLPAQVGLRYAARKATSTPQGKEGLAALSKVGLRDAASLGQVTQDPIIQTTEQYARLYPFAQRRAMEGDARRASIAMRQLEALTSSLEAGASRASDKGMRLIKTYDRAVGSLEKVRSNNATALYGRVRELAGDAPLFDVNKSYAEIVRQIGEHSAPGETATVADLLRLRAAWRGDQITEELARKQADDLIATMRHPVTGAPPPDRVVSAIMSEVERAKAAGVFDEELPKLTAAQMQHLQRVYGERATRTGNLFTDLQGHAVRRGVAAKIASALSDDLDDAAAAGGLPGDVADAIRAANAQYKADSGRINEALSLSISKILGKTRAADSAALTPEAVLDRWFKLEPHQKRATRRILASHDPQYVNYLGAEAFRRAMKAATAPAVPALYPRSGGEVRFDVRKFYTALPSGENWDVLWEGAPRTRILANNVKQALGRLANEGNVVLTGPREGAFFRFRVGVSMATGALAKSVTAPTQAVSEIAVLLSPNTIAEGFLTAEGQRNLLTLSRYAGKTVSADKIADVARAMAYFSALEAENAAVSGLSDAAAPTEQTPQP